MNVKKSNLNARFVFIEPPSLEELERRLRSRRSESDEAIQQRLDTARKEFAYAEQEGSHGKIILNDDIDSAYAELEAFCLAN
jgi:guanylate kinase